MEQTTQLKKNDILTGSIGKAILGFFFPILIGTFFQQLYNTIDAVVVGILPARPPWPASAAPPPSSSIWWSASLRAFPPAAR